MLASALSTFSTASASLCSSHACDPSSVSTVMLGCLACVYFLSPASLSLCSPPTRAPLQRRADQRSTRSTRRSARHKRPRHQGETPRPHSCRAPFLSHHVQAYCNALAPPASPICMVCAHWHITSLGVAQGVNGGFYPLHRLMKIRINFLISSY
jgi:hypothetical protein